MKDTYYVYIMLCENNFYHIGITSDIDKYTIAGKSPSRKFTKINPPIEIRVIKKFDKLAHARQFKKELLKKVKSLEDKKKIFSSSTHCL